MATLQKVATYKVPMKSDNGTFHIAATGPHLTKGARTLCGRDASEWMRMGELEDHELNSAWLCARCHKKATE
jgi:hypothetical protein